MGESSNPGFQYKTITCLTTLVREGRWKLLLMQVSLGYTCKLCIQFVLPMVIEKSNSMNPHPVTDEVMLPLAIVHNMIAVVARVSASARHNPIMR